MTGRHRVTQRGELDQAKLGNFEERHQGIGYYALTRKTPALAGTTKPPGSRGADQPEDPRAGGDDLLTHYAVTVTSGRPPRWRGRRPAPDRHGSGPGKTPALAGTTTARLREPLSGGEDPRAGGDDGDDDPVAARHRGRPPRWRGRRGAGPAGASRHGRPPRWRGRLSVVYDERQPDGKTPALAGTTTPAATCATPKEEDPRAGGDDPLVDRWRLDTVGRPPRWRGRRGSPTHGRPHRGKTPALAGTTPTEPGVTTRRQEDPRAGGDDVHTPVKPNSSEGRPPRWRGRQACQP